LLSGASLPRELADLINPPAEAHLWGLIPKGPRVGLVGTREPSREGFRIAFAAARQLAALGMTIVSGGALGIDRAAHLGALRARGSTLVVAPLWYERAYPNENRKLFARLVRSGHGYLTVSAADAAPVTPTFHRRNRILAALSDVLLLGETGTPSGGLNAVKFARDLGVPVLVLPWSTRAFDTRGTQNELERGKMGYFNPVQVIRLLEGRIFDNPVYWERSARAVEERDRALEAKEQARARKSKRKAKTTRGKAQRSGAPGAPPARSDDPILGAVAAGMTTIDAIVDHTGEGAAVVQHRVLRLTLEGAVYRDAAGLLRVGQLPP